MFWHRESTGEGDLRVEVAFTDSTLDLQGLRPDFPAELARAERACGVRFARLDQVHGDHVEQVDAPGPEATGAVPTGDALVTARRDVGLMVRVADCVPVLLADERAGVVGAAHAGRGGMMLDVVTRTLETMTAQGADPERTTAWIGPHVCGGCYEVPEEMREAAREVEPASAARTRWGTPSIDVGAGVQAQLARAGCRTVTVAGCTREDPGLHSHRRDGAAAGRLAGLVWLA